MEQIFILLILFQVKHFLCDYPLQTQFMLKKSQEHLWQFPLFCHAGVHAIGTMIIAMLFIPDGVYDIGIGYFAVVPVLGLLDLIVHFTVDRVKASPKLLGRYKPDNPKFWWSLGGDQMFHHLTHYLIIFIIISHI